MTSLNPTTGFMHLEKSHLTGSHQRMADLQLFSDLIFLISRTTWRFFAMRLVYHKFMCFAHGRRCEAPEH